MNRIQTPSETVHLLSNTTDEQTLKKAWEEAYDLYKNNQFSCVDKKELFRFLKTTPKAKIKAFLPLDFEFELAGKTKFKTNQLWLSARSQFFSELVHNSSKVLHTFSLDQCDPDVFSVIKKFLKNGELELPNSLMTEKVLEKAIEWHLAGLVTQVLEKFTINEENYQSLYGLMKKYRSMKLKCKILDFVENALCHEFLIKVYPFCLEEQDDAIQKLCEKYFLKHLNDYINPDTKKVLIRHKQICLPILTNFRSTIDEETLSKLSLTQSFCLFQLVPSMITFSFAPYPEKEIRALMESLPLLKVVMSEEKNLRSFVLFRNAWINLVQINQIQAIKNREIPDFLSDFANILYDRFPFEKDCPLIDVVICYLSNLIPNEKILKKLVDERLINKATPMDFKLHILLNFNQFIEQGDSEKILTLCRRSFESNFKVYEVLLRIPLNFLQMPICQILNLKSTPKEQFCNGLRKCQNILTASLMLENFLTYINQNVWKKQFSKLISKLSHFEISNQTRKLLLEDTVLTHLQKSLIYKSLKNVGRNYFETFLRIMNCHQILMQDVRLNYEPIISSQELSEMTALPPKAFHPGYIKKHREIFENFIPRIQETKEVILQSAEEVGHYTRILQNLYSYLKFGDLKKLRMRLESEGSKFKRYETIFFEELNLFTKQLEWDKDLKSKTELYLAKRSNEAIKLFALSNHKVNLFVQKAGALTHVLLDGPLQDAEEIKKDLVFTPTKRSRRRRRKKENQVEKNEANEKEKELKNSLVELQLGEKECRLVESNKEVTLEEHLQKTRENLNHLVGLAKDCQEMGFEESIINAHHHVADLLCLLYRFFDQSQTLSAEQLFGFVIDCVRRGSLMTEQLLMGLRLKTNPVDHQEKLREVYSHDLYSILIHCKFFAGPLSANMRKWIRETSRGDIFVRDITKWGQNDSFVKRLLAKAQSFLQGNSQINPYEIIEDVFVYLRKIAELSEHLEKQIIASDPKLKKYGNHAFHDFSELCVTLSQELLKRNITIVSLNSNGNPLTPIAQTLNAWQSHSDNQYDFENVFQNFLPHLQAEMQQENTLHPLYEHLHLENVLLLNQMMAEEIFLALIDECQSPLVDWEEHDLLGLVTHLGMRSRDFSKEELDFLNRGKATRQIVRYPACYKKSLSKDRKSNASVILQILQKAKMNSTKEKFSHLFNLEDGFQIGDKEQASVHKKTKALALKDVDTLSKILDKVYKKQLKQS